MILESKIEKLINYALTTKLIEKTDIIYTRNQLFDFFNLVQVSPNKISMNKPALKVDAIFDDILSYIQTQPKLIDILGQNKDIILTKIMNIFIPRPSDIITKFNFIKINYGIDKAIDYYYKLSVDSQYIKSSAFKNTSWTHSSTYGKLTITINLTKPEKDPKEIEAVKQQPVNLTYPKCLLCIENEGFSGNYNLPSRYTHRLIPLILNKKHWYFQYSPYAYYQEHSIIINQKHSFMITNQDTFITLFDFVDQMPKYFIGANADLAIIGGSILNHDHFQAGLHFFPMESAQTKYLIKWSDFPEISGEILAWPLSVIRLSSNNRNNLIILATAILKRWYIYSDPEIDLITYPKLRHNAITTILRKIDANNYSLNLILRNNRCTKEFPFGIFHPHQKLHHIKKENIGLIEAMGLAILPGRLNKELDLITQLLLKNNMNLIKSIRKNNPLYKHKDWLVQILNQHINKKQLLSKTKIKQLLNREIGKKFVEILETAGVFKNTKDGNEALLRFVNAVGGICF